MHMGFCWCKLSEVTLNNTHARPNLWFCIILKQLVPDCLIYRKQFGRGIEGVPELKGLINTCTCTHTYPISPETAEANYSLQTSRPAQEMLYFSIQKEVICSQCCNGLVMLKYSDIQPSTMKSAFALLLYDPHTFCRVRGCLLYFEMQEGFPVPT